MKISKLTNKAHKPFKEHDSSPASQGYGHGWCRELNRTWSNVHYAVMSRELKTTWGRVTHYFITTAGGHDIPWYDKQVIKNKIAGYDKTAIEVFPAQEDLIDAANSYHLWVLHDVELPFGLHPKKGGAA